VTGAEIATIVGQLGASGIFVVGIAIVSSKFYAHYEAEILYLRSEVAKLQAELIDLRRAMK